jgi:4-hydroxy-3-polyprenylbenzoate decarboxylase
MVRATTVPLWIPANAEIVIEGWVNSDAGRHRLGPARPKRRPSWQRAPPSKGPFGDHTGFYSMPDRYPLLEVTAITHRKNPSIRRRSWDCRRRRITTLARRRSDCSCLLKTIVHDIEDYDLPSSARSTTRVREDQEGVSATRHAA